MSITTDTRFESLQKLDKKHLQNLIVATLREHPKEGLTTRETAVILYDKGFLHSNERQATAPRLTELVDEGIVRVIGKRFDKITRKNVAVYAIC